MEIGTVNRLEDSARRSPLVELGMMDLPLIQDDLQQRRDLITSERLRQPSTARAQRGLPEFDASRRSRSPVTGPGR